MSLIDRSRGTVTGPDGVVTDVVTEPLTDAEALLLGQYETWLRTEALTRWPLICVACDAEAIPYVEPTQIGISCPHRLLHYRGVVPVQDVTPPVVESVILLGPQETQIPVADAWMLREYRKFLQRRGLREGLGCQRCDDAGRAPGCKTIVGTSTITVACRCTTRVFQGMTF